MSKYKHAVDLKWISRKYGLGGGILNGFRNRVGSKFQSRRGRLTDRLGEIFQHGRIGRIWDGPINNLGSKLQCGG